MSSILALPDMENIVAPASPFQYKILNSNAKIIVCGGAVGASKTHIGVMRHLRYIDNPHYVGYCIRKNSTTIMKSGGLFEKALEIFRQVDPKCVPRLKAQEIVFSTGAKVAFGGYENRNSSEKYRGIEIQAILYDEGTDAEEEDIWLLYSRLRSAKPVIDSDGNKSPLPLWITCNPNPDSYLAKWVDWYLYPKGHPLAGRANPQRNGVVRYMLRVDGQIVWGESEQELIQKYGKYREVNPISFTCFLGTIHDNPVLLKNNPEYLYNLEALPRIKKERDLYGNWFAREEHGGYFKRGWLEEIIEPPAKSDFVKVVRAWDLAGSLKTDANPDPDYTAGVKMGLLKSGDYVILDVVKFRALAGDVDNKIIEVAQSDGKSVDIIIPKDAGVGGKYVARALVQRITSEGFYARVFGTSGSKVDRFRPFSSAAQNGLVKILKNCCDDLENKIYNNNDFFYDELEKFEGRREKNDMADATADAFYGLARKQHSGNFLEGLKSVNFNIRNEFALARYGA